MGRDLDVRTVRVGIAVLVGLAVLVFVLISVFGGDDDSGGGDNAPGVVGLSESELVDQANDLGNIFYWVGPRPVTDQYEFTATSDGRIYVRYLTEGAEPGDPDADFLSVGTYVVEDAARALERAAKDSGERVVTADGYTLLPGMQDNAYVVFDSQPDLQIEIYSPEPDEAVELATSGDLEQVDR
jgi:hypothetical protein